MEGIPRQLSVSLGFPVTGASARLRLGAHVTPPGRRRSLGLSRGSRPAAAPRGSRTATRLAAGPPAFSSMAPKLRAPSHTLQPLSSSRLEGAGESGLGLPGPRCLGRGQGGHLSWHPPLRLLQNKASKLWGSISGAWWGAGRQQRCANPELVCTSAIPPALPLAPSPLPCFWSIPDSQVI